MTDTVQDAISRYYDTSSPSKDLTGVHGRNLARATGSPPRRPYRPSSGTEGACFQENWCGHCARDAVFRETGYDGDPALGCQILAATFRHDINDPEYPKEWVYGDDGSPRCTAFTTDPACPVRCDKTVDMFAGR